MITTVIFDLDDTLYDEIEYCRSGLRAASEWLAQRQGRPAAEELLEVMWSEFEAGNRRQVFNAAIRKLGICSSSEEKQLVSELVEVYRGHSPNIVLPGESRKVLGVLKDRYVLGLITDGYLPAQRLKVEALGLERYFRCIVYTEELGRDCWKPSAVGFERIMGIAGAAAETIAFVADNAKKDFIAPNKLGFFTVQILRPARLHLGSGEHSGSSAGYVIERISELPGLLESL